MTAPATHTAAHAAAAGLWSGLKLVAIDVETCKPPGQPRRVVAAAVVTCKLGRRVGSWFTFVDPQTPIDADSLAIHGIDDTLVAGEPTLDDIADQLDDLLTPNHDDERVLLAAHNVGFDVSTLHADLGRFGRQLTDVQLLDTSSKTLLDLLDVYPVRRRLPDVADALDINPGRHHDASDDARACADIACALLARAARAGFDDLDDLLDTAGAGATAGSIKAASARATGRRDRQLPTRAVDDTHLATHADVLPDDPDRATLDGWTAAVIDCGVQRCPDLPDRIAAADAAPQQVLAVVTDALDQLLADDPPDGPAVATVLGGLLPLLEHLPPKNKGRHGVREAAFDWAATRAAGLDPLDRCDEDRCPDCQAGRPCPLDVWRLELAPLVVGNFADRARGVLRPNGVNKGTGTYTTWLRRGLDQGLADEALAAVVRYWQADDNQNWARTVAHDAFDLGCTHPHIVLPVAAARADAGTEQDLQAALDIIDVQLQRQHGSSHPAWRHLVQYGRLLAGQLQRARGIDTGTIDDDGNPIYQPRHHPTNPRRDPHPRRFG